MSLIRPLAIQDGEVLGIFLFPGPQASRAGLPFTACVCIRMCSVTQSGQLFATPLIVASQVSLSMGFPKQEYWSRLPFLTPGHVPDPGIEPRSLVSPALAANS